MPEATLVFKGSDKPNALPPKETAPIHPSVPLAPVVGAVEKPVKAHKLFKALFNIAIKKFPQLRDDLELDQNDCDLLDEAFGPILRKAFTALGVKDSYMGVIIACIVVLVPRFILIGGEMVHPKPSPKPRPPEAPAAKPETPEKRAERAESKPPSSVSPAGASNWSWGGKTA